MLWGSRSSGERRGARTNVSLFAGSAAGDVHDLYISSCSNDTCLAKGMSADTACGCEWRVLGRGHSG